MHIPPSLLNLLVEPPAAARVYDVPPATARRSWMRGLRRRAAGYARRSPSTAATRR